MMTDTKARVAVKRLALSEGVKIKAFRDKAESQIDRETPTASISSERLALNDCVKIKAKRFRDRAKVRPHYGRRARRGLAMTDMGFAFLLAIFALAAISAMFLIGRGNGRDASATVLYTQIIANVETSFANTTTYPSGDLIQLLDAGGYVPNSARVEATSGTVTMVSPYGTPVTIVGSGGADYTITFESLKKEACVKLLENAVGFSLNPMKDVVLGSTSQTLPLTKSAISTGCDSASTNVAVTY